MVGQLWLTGQTLGSPVVFLMRGRLQTTSGKTSRGFFLLVQSLCKVRKISVDVRDIRGECLGVTTRCSLFHVQSIPLTLYCKDYQWHHYYHNTTYTFTRDQCKLSRNTLLTAATQIKECQHVRHLWHWRWSHVVLNVFKDFKTEKN